MHLPLVSRPMQTFCIQMHTQAWRLGLPDSFAAFAREHLSTAVVAKHVCVCVYVYFVCLGRLLVLCG